MSPRDVFGDTFRSLRIRNYRLFTTGQLVSISGTWMQTMALSWLVLKGLHGSGIALGIVTALQFLPTALFGLWGGLIADRLDKRLVLIVTQAALALFAIALGVLTLAGSIQLWMVCVLAFLSGCATAIDTPVRQAFVIEMVGPGPEVANAVGLNSAVFNTARIIGPALAGIVIVSLGTGAAFLLNGASYFASIGALLLMDQRALHLTEKLERARGQVREGLRYVWRVPEMRRAILLMLVVATVGMNFSVTVPLIATSTFHRDAGGLSVLMSIMALGALVGALATARRARPTPRLLVATAALFGVSATLTSLAPNVWLVAPMLALTGGAGMAFISTTNSTLQLLSPAALRGRVMAIYALVFLGSTPVGAPLVGWISQQWNARAGVAFGGVVSLIAAGVAWLTRPAPAGRHVIDLDEHEREAASSTA